MEQEDWTPHMDPQALSDLSIELQKIKILLDFVEDQLRWGKNLASHFNLKEA